MPNLLVPGAPAQVIPIAFDSPNHGNAGGGTDGTNLPQNQDDCKNATITLSYAGTP